MTILAIYGNLINPIGVAVQATSTMDPSSAALCCGRHYHNLRGGMMLFKKLAFVALAASALLAACGGGDKITGIDQKPCATNFPGSTCQDPTKVNKPIPDYDLVIGKTYTTFQHKATDFYGVGNYGVVTSLQDNKCIVLGMSDGHALDTAYAIGSNAAGRVRCTISPDGAWMTLPWSSTTTKIISLMNHAQVDTIRCKDSGMFTDVEPLTATTVGYGCTDHTVSIKMLKTSASGPFLSAGVSLVQWTAPTAASLDQITELGMGGLIYVTYSDATSELRRDGGTSGDYRTIGNGTIVGPFPGYRPGDPSNAEARSVFSADGSYIYMAAGTKVSMFRTSDNGLVASADLASVIPSQYGQNIQFLFYSQAKSRLYVGLGQGGVISLKGDLSDADKPWTLQVSQHLDRILGLTSCGLGASQVCAVIPAGIVEVDEVQKTS